MGNDPRDTGIRIPVLRTVAETYVFNLQHWRSFVVWVLSLAFVLAAYDLIVSRIFPLPVVQDPFNAQKLVVYSTLGLVTYELYSGLLTVAGCVFLWVAFSVAWHRHNLIPNEPISLGGVLLWRFHHLRYFVNVVGLALLLLLVGLFYDWAILPLLDIAMLFASPKDPEHWRETASVISGIVLFLLILPVVLRAALALPAVAIGKPLRLRQSWDLVTGNTVRLTVIFLLVELPVWICDRLLYGTIPLAMRSVRPTFHSQEFAETVVMVEMGQSDIGDLGLVTLGATLENIVWLCGVALGVSMLSISYRALSPALPAGPEDDAKVA